MTQRISVAALQGRGAGWTAVSLPAAVRWLRRGLEAGLLVLVALSLVRLSYGLLETPGVIAGPEARVAAGGSAPPAPRNPFVPLAPATAGPATSAALTGLVLVGVRSDLATGRGGAMIQLPDGSQRAFGVGEAVVDGLTLSEVWFDHVVLAGAGGSRRLAFPEQPSSFTRAAAEPAAPTAAVVPMALQGGRTGWRLPATGMPPALVAAGLRPGDIVTTIDGRSVADGAALLEAVRQLQSVPDPDRGIALEVLRGGQTLRLTIAAGAIVP